MNLILPICIGAICLLAIWSLVGWIIAISFLRKDHHHHNEVETPRDRGITAKRLLIPCHVLDPNADHEVAAWMLIPDPDRAHDGACVVMVHGFDSGKDRVKTCEKDPGYRSCTLDQGAIALRRAGFIVVAIDLRNHGESGDAGNVSLGAREAYDVLATVEYLSKNARQYGINPSRIGLRGESMGGAACLIAAAIDQNKRVAAVWSDSAFGTASEAIADFIGFKGVPRIFVAPARFWFSRLTGIRLKDASPVEYVGQIECPVFLTHSSGDSVLPVYHLKTLSESQEWQQQPEVWQLELYEHNRLWLDPDYQDRQIDFFNRRLAS